MLESSSGPDAQSNPQICKFFRRSGWCKFGDQCRFVHSRESTSSNQNARGRSSVGDRRGAGRVRGGNDRDVNYRRGNDHDGNEHNSAQESHSEIQPQSAGRSRGRGGGRPFHRGARYPRRHGRGGFYRGGFGGRRDEAGWREETAEGDPGDVVQVKQAEEGRSIELEEPEGACELKQGDEGQPDDDPMPQAGQARPQTGSGAPGSVNENDQQLDDSQRSTEVRQLLRRFPKTVAVNGGLDFELPFASSDPDWPYDVKEVGLRITLPKEYPREEMRILLPDMMPVNLPIPEVLRQFAEDEIGRWIRVRFDAMNENGTPELALRPFFRWLDRNMEPIFTEGLLRTKREIANQTSGLKFINNERKEKKFAEEIPEEKKDDEDESDEDDEDEWEDDQRVPDRDDDLEDSDIESPAQMRPQNQGGNAGGGAEAPVRKGTEIKLINLELGETVALIRLVALVLMIQCSRCKKKQEVSLGPGKSLTKVCDKCRTASTIQFRPTVAHLHSPVLGFLDIFGATPFDLVTVASKFSVQCFACDKGQSPRGLHAGRSSNSFFCANCHAKLQLSFTSVKFTALVANEAFAPSQGVNIKLEKKTPKTLGIREGHPLPQSGTCVHYKKSFRWLRFSCCGRVFPCDRCHEEEIDDHEPDFAPKMICGHCSKEQPFHKDKPCAHCGESTTRQRSTHWEGGKGCRNKVKMSTTDKQKYRNCNKTMSKKAQEKIDGKVGNDKKETKLRHS